MYCNFVLVFRFKVLKSGLHRYIYSIYALHGGAEGGLLAPEIPVEG